MLQEVLDTDFMQALNHHHLMIHHHNRHHHYHHHPYHHHQHFQVRDGEEGGLYSWRPANYSNFWGRFVKIMIIIQKYKMREARKVRPDSVVFEILKGGIVNDGHAERFLH